MDRYVDAPRTYIDRDGWTQKSPVSDERCVLMCLRNCLKLDGMDKKQVARLIEEYEVKAEKAGWPPEPTTQGEYDGRN